jgi:hypothetical protein
VEKKVACTGVREEVSKFNMATPVQA